MRGGGKYFPGILLLHSFRNAEAGSAILHTFHNEIVIDFKKFGVRFYGLEGGRPSLAIQQ